MILIAVLMVISAAVALIQGQMEDLLVPLLVLPAVLPPFLIEKWARVHIPGSVQAQYALLLLAGPYVGEHLGLYHLWDPWDKWVHLYSGFFISFTIVFALGVVLRRYGLSLPPWVEAVILISLKASVALFWEVAEFFWDLALGTSAQDHNFDTMTDMMLGTAPGFLIAGLLILHRTKRRIRYLENLLNAPLPKSSS